MVEYGCYPICYSYRKTNGVNCPFPKFWEINVVVL